MLQLGMRTPVAVAERSAHTSTSHHPTSLIWICPGSVLLLAGLSADLGVPGGALAAELEQLDDHALVEGSTGPERRH